MDEDRLRWLVIEHKHMTLEGASEIAKNAPALLRLIEQQSSLLRESRRFIEEDPTSLTREALLARIQGR